MTGWKKKIKMENDIERENITDGIKKEKNKNRMI